MHEVTRDRVGTSLRRMAENLVSARRRVALLERENHELKKQLEALQRQGEGGRQPRVEASH
jgi:hypothetical protein